MKLPNPKFGNYPQSLVNKEGYIVSLDWKELRDKEAQTHNTRSELHLK